MKFTEHLSAHITPEWRKQYISYEEMKSMLGAAVEQAPSAELVEPEVLSRYFAKFDETFFHYCDKELTKINTFFSEKLAESTRKYGNLTSELSEALEIESEGNRNFFHKAKILKKRDVPTRKLKELKLAFSEFYLSLILLQNYQNLNSTGFRKILKKHDKLLSSDAGAIWRSERVETAAFHINKDIDRLISEVEVVVTEKMEGGNRGRAMKRLRVPPLTDRNNPWTTFKVGLFSGSFLVLILAVAISCASHWNSGGAVWEAAMRLFRCPLLIVQFLLLMGLNVYGWRSSGVNHVLIFELDPRNHLSDQHIVEMAASFGVVWAVAVLGFIYSENIGVPRFAYPIGLNVLMICFLLNPTKTLRYEARFWSLRILGRIVASPFFYVNFADFWLADQLTSLVPIFTDFVYFSCFYATLDNWKTTTGSQQEFCSEKTFIAKAVVTCLPTWFRFAQCLRRYRDSKEKFPHLANAAKYSTTFFVVLFANLYKANSKIYAMSSNPYLYFWIMASLVSTCYSYTWDIKMDWGLFDKRAGDNKFLREEVVYSSSSYYYFAIVEDLLLRLGWVLSLSLTEMGLVHAELMLTILSCLEVFRRFVWNFFRLENEHVNNCGKFRAVRDISVAPMESSDQSEIIKMMDSEDGVINRYRKKMPKKKETKLLLEPPTTHSSEVIKNKWKNITST